MSRHGLRRWVPIWGTGFGFAALAGPALAQASTPEPLRVAFTGPTECGASDRLLEFSRDLLGADADHTGVAVTAKVTAAVTAGGERRYKLRLELRGAVTGDRTISGANCDEALRAGAVVVALAINPNALATPPGDPPPAKADAEPPTSAAPTSEPPQTAALPNAAVPKPGASQLAVVLDPPDPLPDSADELPDATELQAERLVFGVLGRVAYGLAPSPRFGVKAVVGVVWNDVQVRAHGYFDPSTQHEDALAGGVRFTSLGGGADLCARVWNWSRLSASVCGGWSLTEVNASAPNVASPTAQDAFVSAGALGASLGVRLLERISLSVEGGYSIPTSRPRFVVDVAGADSVPVFRVAPGPLASVGLQFGL